MKLSIIIVSFNTKNATRECIDSVLANCKRDEFEIIVVDNRSTDSTTSLLREYWKKNKNIKLIENNENLGFSKAVNQGIDVAKGNQILLLNSDILLLEGSIEKAIGFVEKNKDVGVVGFRLLNKDLTIQPSCYNFPTILNAIKEYVLKIEGAYDKFYPQGNLAVEVEAVVGAAFLITEKAREIVGKLDEKYFMYMEDIEYCRRVKERGLKVFYLPQAKVIHLHGESGKGKSKLQFKRLVESSKLYHGIVKYYVINTIIKLGQKLSI